MIKRHTNPAATTYHKPHNEFFLHKDDESSKENVKMKNRSKLNMLAVVCRSLYRYENSNSSPSTTQLASNFQCARWTSPSSLLLSALRPMKEKSFIHEYAWRIIKLTKLKLYNGRIKILK